MRANKHLDSWKLELVLGNILATSRNCVIRFVMSQCSSHRDSESTLWYPVPHYIINKLLMGPSLDEESKATLERIIGQFHAHQVKLHPVYLVVCLVGYLRLKETKTVTDTWILTIFLFLIILPFWKKAILFAPIKSSTFTLSDPHEDLQCGPRKYVGHNSINM